MQRLQLLELLAAAPLISAARADQDLMPVVLAPGKAGMLRGEPGDKWLNIEMQPGGSPTNTVGNAATAPSR